MHRRYLPFLNILNRNGIQSTLKSSQIAIRSVSLEAETAFEERTNEVRKEKKKVEGDRSFFQIFHDFSSESLIEEEAGISRNREIERARRNPSSTRMDNNIRYQACLCHVSIVVKPMVNDEAWPGAGSSLHVTFANQLSNQLSRGTWHAPRIRDHDGNNIW